VLLPAGRSQLSDEAPPLGLAQQFIPVLADHLKLSQTVHVVLLPKSLNAPYTSVCFVP